MVNSKPALLAPAGSISALKAAVYSGADAVYLGMDAFNARSSAENFNCQNIGEWINFANLFGVKVHIAFNTLIKDSEFHKLFDLAQAAADANAYAFIVQDLGAVSLFKSAFPDMRLHASTQLGVHTVEGAKEAKHMGFSQVVLSRETPLEVISEISKIIDTEVFIHGALCVSFSGNCYLSSNIFSSSANRGGCLQPCRKLYSALRQGRAVSQGYLLSPKDLNLSDKLSALRDAGVSCFKIEGRMRRPEYVAQATGYYRKLLDGGQASKEDVSRLKAVYNRGGFTKGYYFGTDTADIMFKDAPGHFGEYAGKIECVVSDIAYVRTARRLSKDDAFKIFEVLESGRHNECANAVYTGAPPSGNVYPLAFKGIVKPGMAVRITTDTAQLQGLRSRIKKIPLKMRFEAHAGRPCSLDVVLQTDISAFKHITEKTGHMLKVSVLGLPVLRADKAALKPEDIIARLKRLNDERFEADIELDCEEDIFLPVSAINELRRNAMTLLYKEIELLKTPRIVLCKAPDLHSTMQVSYGNSTSKHQGNALIVNDDSQALAQHAELFDILVYAPDDYTMKGCSDFMSRARVLDKEIFLALPVFLHDADRGLIDKILNECKFDGLLINNIGQLSYSSKYRIIAGEELNTFNTKALGVLKASGCAAALLSPELSLSEIEGVLSEDSCIQKYLKVYGRSNAMTLLHCPFQNVYGNNCQTCTYSNDFSYRDEKGMMFPLHRKRLSGCSFTLKNSVVFQALSKLNSQNCPFLFDFTHTDSYEIDKILSYYKDKFVLKSNSLPALVGYTSGNLFRGV